jgi:transcriptional regulator with XRE-family HTH domain
MNEIGSKIREARKLRGLSQEQLAENAKVNLRTIQRIENNKSAPRGKTLTLICSALGLRPEDILSFSQQPDHSYLFLFHLSVLAFLVLPFGNIIVPFILWMNNKDKVIGLKAAGTNLLHFQIVWTVVTTISLIAFAFSKMKHYPSNALLFLTVALFVFNIIYPVYLAILSNKGVDKSYPKMVGGK